MTTVLLVAAGGAVGAVLRYLANWHVTARHGATFPWATLAVNVSGSALLGLLVAGLRADAVSSELVALLGIGLCGALTTYSTFAWEAVELPRASGPRSATAYVLATVAGALAAAALGWAVGTSLWA